MTAQAALFHPPGALMVHPECGALALASEHGGCLWCRDTGPAAMRPATADDIARAEQADEAWWTEREAAMPRKGAA